MLAVAFVGCTEPARPHLLSDDLEPALTQETMGRSGADRDPDLSRDAAQLFYASTSHDRAYAL